MKSRDFLKQLKEEARVVKALQQEKFIPQELSSIANFVATHAWQVLLFLGIFASFFWELFFYQGQP